MENLILGEGLLCDSVVVAEQMGSEILRSDFGEQSCLKDEELVVHNVGESSVPDRSPGFYRDDNAGCVSSDEVNESVSVERDGLLCGGDDNVSVLEEEECLNSEYGIGGCGVGGCSNRESSEMKLKEGWCRGEDGFDPGNGVQQDELRDDLSADPSLSSEGVVNVKEEQGDLPSEVVDMDACGDHSVFSVNSLEAASVKGVVLTGIEAAALSNRISPAQDGEMSLEVAPQSVSPGNGIQRDEQRDDLSVDRLSSEGVMDVKEEQGDLPSELVDMEDYSVFSVHSLDAASEKAVVLTGIKTAVLSNRISLAHDGEMFPEVVATGDMVSNCNWKNEHIDDNGVGRVKDLCNGKTTEVFDAFDQILFRREKQDFGNTFEDLPMSATPSSSAQLNDLRSNNIIDCSLVDRATEFIEEKSNVMADVQAEIDTRISTIGFNVSYLKEGSSDVAANCIIGNSISLQSCDAFSIFNNSADGVYADSFPEVVEMKSNIDPCNQTFPPEEKHTRDFEGLYVSDSPIVCTLENDQKSVELIGFPSSETVNECLEQKVDYTNVEIGTQIVLKEDKSSNLNEGSSGLSPHNTIEESVSLQLYQPLDNGINGSSKRVDVQDTNDSPGNVESSTLYDHSGQMDHEGNDSFGVDCVYHTKFSTIIALSAQRSGRSRKTQTKKSPRKCRNTSKVLQPLAESVFKGAGRKRSCLSKPPRSSTWGLLGSVTQSFEESNGLEVFQVFKDQKEGSQKRRGSRRGEKQIHTGETVNSQVSRGTKSNPLRLKVKFGKEVDKSSLCINVPEVVNTSASANSVQELNVIEGNCRQEATIKKCQPTSKIPFQDGVFVTENSAENEIEIGHGVTSLATAASSGGSAGSSYIDPGTSPDSEVINLVPEAHVEAKPQEDSHDTVLASDKVMSALVNLTSSKREKKKHKSPYSGNCVQEDGSPSMMKAEPSTNQDVCRKNVRRDIFSSETFTQSPGAKAVSNSSSDAEFSVEPLCLSEVIISKEVLKVERGPEAETDCNLDVGLSSSKSPTFKNMLPSSKKKGQKPPKGKSRASDSASKRSNARKPRENNQKSLSKKKVKDDKQLACKVESPHDSGDPLVDGVGNGNSAHDAVLNLDVVPADIDKQYLPPRQAWVLCDACNKWRQIPADLADYIDETKCTWTCGLNEDINFADCSIPQEKSNAEINAELEISDASGEDDASDRQLHYKTLEYRRPSVSQQHVSSIKTNQFLHRNRKNQSIDEIMVCHCKTPSNGKLGCGDDCLNRMLNIECVRGTCPCGDLCSNQQFQKRRYAKLEKFPSGKKGFGLRSLDHIFEGQFLIEYVGEVLDTHAYEARLKEYAVKGHRHFYFMTLNTSEVIDACAKGNLGRFINHSCDPNCRTEKWMVNGEVCIGLFALRDIKKGEEVTFDYNFVRVIGAAAKKCHCGSPHCQGFIGGDPLNTEVTIQDDSDEEYVEPVMIPEDGLSEDSKSNMELGDGFDDSGIVKHEEIVSTNKELDKSIISVGDLETTTKIEESDNQYTLELEHLKPPSSVQRVEAFGEKETISEKSSNSFERPEITSPRKISIPISDGVDSKKQFKVDTIHRNVKTSRLSSSVKKGKVRSTPLSTNKIQVVSNKAHVLPFKPKRSIEGSVEEKLNELLDVDGGISKRKDSTKGYLKLLFLTAQSGDSGSGEAIKSNRDLSIILDALVKTKSRAVLVDIINKNGLRMLHNIMKMCRRDFNKIPILRKLLKVLEYLAEKPQILTQEHITGGPPCPGMESFTESILSLTEHDDKTVHQIARNFRNRWIPRAFRRHNFVDRDDRNRGSNYNRFSTSHDNWHDQSGRSTEVAECVKQSGVNMPPSASTGLQEGSSTPSAGSCPSSVTKVRKRKSRWDQPAETVSDPISLPNKEQKMEPGLNTQIESNVLPQADDVTFHPEANLAFDGKRNNLEDVPPGFSSCLNTPVVSSVASSPSSVMGSPQAKFVSRLPVSYGIPLSIVQQYGTAHAETADTWVVAPGMPFRPFPPLPPGPRPKEDASHSHDVNLVSVNHASEGHQASFVPGNCQSEESTRSTTSATQVDFDMASANNDLCSKRQREFSYESPMGRRYFKQQKWNHPKPRPPWIRDRNGWGCNGNNFRGGTNSIGVGNVPNELRTPAGNNVDQHSQHH